MKIVELESKDPLVRKFQVKREGEEDFRPRIAIDAEGIPQLNSPHSNSKFFVVWKILTPIVNNIYEVTVKYGNEDESFRMVANQVIFGD